MIQLEQIKTQRLRGEKICESHWQYWLEIGSNPTVMAILGSVWNLEKAKQKMQFNCQEWERHGHGQWIFFLQDTEEFIGRGGIRKVTVDGKEEVELGYVLMPDFWGQGLAVEIGKKALAIAFERFNYPSVVAYTLVDNYKSQRVMQKIGFAYEKNLIHANFPHVLYRYQNPKYAT